MRNLTSLAFLLPLGFPGALGLGRAVSRPVVGLETSARAAQPRVPLRFELPNGLRVWVQEDHTRSIVLVQTTYKAGSINDGPGMTGTAHYVEHMAYRATQNIPNEDIYGFIDRIGGRYTGGTAQLATTYTETVPVWALEETLRTNAERMGRVLFDSTEFERERTNVVTEANSFVGATATQILRSEVMSASFELHPYRQGSATWAQDNLVLTRDQAAGFYRDYYGPNNAVLTVVGDVAAGAVRALVEKHFGPLTRAPRSGEVRIVEPPQRVEKRVALVYPDEQSHLEVVYRAPNAAHPDYPVLAVLDRVLAARLRPAFTGSVPGELTTAHSATPYPFVYRLSVAAPASADLPRLLSTVQSEIERLGRDGVATPELAAARVDNAPAGGRGGRGGADAAQGGGPGTGTPPRQSNLTQIATQLTSREAMPWEVSAELRERIRRAQEGVTAADIQGYVDRWLRSSMRTVGFHTAGPPNYRADWSTGREVAGTRLVIPPLTTPPAKRMRPAPVPPQSLEPLAKLPIPTGRRRLPNGAVLRAARVTDATGALQVRVRLGAADPNGKEGLSALVARLVAGDAGLQSLAATTSTTALANDGYFDIRVGFPAVNAATVVDAVARALAVRSFSNERVEAERAKLALETAGGVGGRTGGRGSTVNAEARERVLRVVAPAWNVTALATRESVGRLAATDVRDLVARRLNGSALTVSLVAAAAPDELLDITARAISGLPKGDRATAVSNRVPNAAAMVPGTPPAEERVAFATEAQVTVLAGLPGVPRGHADRRALDLLNYIVGVPSYGGRLGWALTKTGLTYSAAAATTFAASTGHIVFSTRCDTRNLESTIQAIREVIAGVGERGVEEWELREAQAFTSGRTLLFGPREDSGADAIAVALLDSELVGDELLDLPAYSRAWLAITAAQINAVARRYYRPELLKVVALGAVPNAPPKAIFPPGTFRALFEP